MVFKLVRTDAVEPCKIQLPSGKLKIGRGKFLNCDDKRVSRNHGELEVTQDSVIVKALHINPCFVLKKGTDETQILKQNCAEQIGNGDRFGLLPDLYWYELLHCTVANGNQLQDLAIAEIKSDADSVETEPYEFENMDASQEKLNSNEYYIHNSNDSPSLLSPEDQDAASADKECLPHSKSPNKRSLNSDSEDSCSAVKKSKIGYEELIVKEESSTSTKPGVIQESSNEQDLTNSVKQVPNDGKDLTKSVKQEPNDRQNLTNSVKQEPNDEKDLGNSVAGPSDDQAGTSCTSDKGTAASPVNPTLKRERCMYGENCYRRNPQHKAQFSHPRDADWGAGARGECPWGAACRRRDARHWRDHDHPPGVRQPATHNAGMRVVQRNGNTFYINAHTVNFYDEHFEVLDSDEDSVDFDYEF